MKDRTFVALSGIFFLLFALGIGMVAFDKPLRYTLRAKDAAPSPLKSFVAVIPQIAQSGDEEKGESPTRVRILINLRDVNGNLLAGRQVKLEASETWVTIVPSNSQNTDKIGQAQFFMTAKNPGTVKLNAVDTSSNTELVNVPSIEFQ